MKKVKWGGVKIEEEKIYSLAYADDIVILSEKEEEMRSMIERLERYLEKKNLELNVGKTKIMRFRKGGGRWKKRVWKWKGRDEWGTESTHKKKGKKSSSSNETSMGNRKEKVWRRLGKKDMDV